MRLIIPVLGRQRQWTQQTCQALSSENSASEKTMPEEWHLRLSSNLIPTFKKKVIFRMQNSYIILIWHNMIKNYWQPGIIGDVWIQSIGWKLLYVCTQVCVKKHIWRTEINTRCLTYLSSPYVLRQGPSLNLQAQKSPCGHLPSVGIPSFFQMGAGD